MTNKETVIRLILACLFLSSASLLQAQQYRSEADNFEIQLPEILYPVNLSYEQDTLVGRVKIKSISFHSSLGKFLVEVADYPVSDQRSAQIRIDAKINQLKANPHRVFENIEHFLSERSPGVMIKSFDGVRSEIRAVFVANRREYHISSESFERGNLEQVMEQTEAIVRSFELLEI